MAADPALFGDIHASRTYASLSDEEVLEMCSYLYERGAFGDYWDDSLPCPADPLGSYFFNVSSCVAYYPGVALDPDWPSVGDVVLCEALRVRDCNAGYDAPSPETETICRRIPVRLCLGEDGPVNEEGLAAPNTRDERDAVVVPRAVILRGRRPENGRNE